MIMQKQTPENTPDNPEKEWFGDTQVTPTQKTQLVRGVFDSVAEKYDLMNDIMSFGVHRLWKNHLIRMIRPRAELHYLDVAGGTGDIATRIRKKTGPNAQITLCDLDEQMLRVGRDRSIDQGMMNDFSWITGNAEYLPIPDNSVDVYTIAFGLRNVTHIDTALTEAIRVLKPGGRFFCLEFSQVQDAALDRLYQLYSDIFIPNVGQMVAGDRDSYQYLVESIRKFPKQKELKSRMEKAGFKSVDYTNLSFGTAAIHKGFVV